MSYGNVFTEIDFQKHPMTLLYGKNGSGKSAFFEALTFGLFGVPYRNINKPNLVNCINEKDCLVEVEFELGQKKYLVRRGMKPNVFEIYCDGNLVNQTATTKEYQTYLEQNILKLNYQSFTQLVMLGSSTYIPFMQLDAQNRREVIEELLDISIFSKMNVALKEKQSFLKEELRRKDSNIQVLKEKIDLQKTHIKNLNKNVSQYIEENNKAILQHQSIIADLTDQIKILDEQRFGIISKFVKDNSLHSTLCKYLEIKTKLIQRAGQINKTIDFYENNNECPTCTQKIDEAFRKTILEEKRNKKNEVESTGIPDINSRIEIVQKKIKESEELDRMYSELTSKISKLEIEVSSENKFISNLVKENVRVSQDTGQTSEEEFKLQKFESDHVEAVAQKEECLNSRHHYDTAHVLLKDTGIKTKIVRQYLPIMNKTINKYLQDMDFFVNFNLDENFKEVIKSRHRDEFEYNSFSEGEKFRIDMALLLTWRDISRRKNSTNTNILLLDEVFDSSLDGVGTEEFLKLLRDLSKKINVFVISHKPDVLADKFDKVYKVEKKNNFSVMK